MNRPNLPDGTLDGDRHLYAVRVYYEDTDLSGITYHANYLRWFERARSDLLRQLEIDQRSAIEAGVGAYAVSEVNLKYLRPAKLDDDVLIETRCTELRAASCRMHHEPSGHLYPLGLGPSPGYFDSRGPPHVVASSTVHRGDAGNAQSLKHPALI